MSRTKKMAVITMFVFAVQMLLVPVQNSYAAECAESAAKSAITTGVVAGGLLLLDGAFGFPVSTATAGTATAAAFAAVKAALVAALYGCVDATLWNKPSIPATQLPQAARR